MLLLFDFSDASSMTDEDYVLWTGWNKATFQSFLPHLADMRNSDRRMVRQALGIFLD